MIKQTKFRTNTLEYSAVNLIKSVQNQVSQESI